MSPAGVKLRMLPNIQSNFIILPLLFTVNNKKPSTTQAWNCGENKQEAEEEDPPGSDCDSSGL